MLAFTLSLLKHNLTGETPTRRRKKRSRKTPNTDANALLRSHFASTLRTTLPTPQPHSTSCGPKAILGKGGNGRTIGGSFALRLLLIHPTDELGESPSRWSVNPGLTPTSPTMFTYYVCMDLPLCPVSPHPPVIRSVSHTLVALS